MLIFDRSVLDRKIKPLIRQECKYGNQTYFLSRSEAGTGWAEGIVPTQNMLAARKIQPYASQMLKEAYKILNRTLPISSVNSNELNVDRSKKWHFTALRFWGGKTEYGSYLPDVLSLVEDELKIPAVTTLFSITKPGLKIIRKHHGYCNFVWRYLLSLRVSGKAYHSVYEGSKMTVTQEWNDTGQEFMFDDTFPHEGRQDATHDRVLLWFDIPRDDCPVMMNVWISFLTKTVVQHADPYVTSTIRNTNRLGRELLERLQKGE